MLGKLAPCGGGPPIALLKPKLLVGRQRFCDIPVNSPTVSSRHCELELLEGYWFVRDLGSSNGTRVNGLLCTAEWLLPQDMLGVARQRFSVLYTPPPDRPPPPRLSTRAEGKSPPAATGATARDDSERPARQQVWQPDANLSTLGELVPCGGGRPIPLLRTKLLIGRHRDCDIVLRYAAVSARHCELQWTDEGWSVRDLDSRNGTRVDGVRTQAQRLPSGSILWIGGLSFEIDYHSEAAPPAPQEERRLFAQSLLEKAGLLHGQPEPEPDH
jgi:adenylate cyclase